MPFIGLSDSKFRNSWDMGDYRETLQKELCID